MELCGSLKVVDEGQGYDMLNYLSRPLSNNCIMANANHLPWLRQIANPGPQAERRKNDQTLLVVDNHFLVRLAKSADPVAKDLGHVRCREP